MEKTAVAVAVAVAATAEEVTVSWDILSWLPMQQASRDDLCFDHKKLVSASP